MPHRPTFDPEDAYSRDLAAGIRQARIPRQARFCIAEDADTAGGICGRPSSPADPGAGCVKHPTKPPMTGKEPPMTTATKFAYWESLFDANRDVMAAYLTGEGGTSAEAAREMIGNAWDVWTSRLCADHPELTRERAQRIINEAIGFLYLAGSTQEPHGPSREVDLGWHVMLSDTRIYAAVCQAVAGRFIHHDAADLLSTDALADGEAKCQTCGSECKAGTPRQELRPLSDTVTALRELGPVDAELWPPASR